MMRRNKPIPWLSIACALLLFVATLPPLAAAENAPVVGTIPNAVSEASAVGDIAGRAYFFGGRYYPNTSTVSRAIVRFDAATGAVTTLLAQLPTPLFNSAAVWVGPSSSGSAYIIGGETATSGPCAAVTSNAIVRFTPSTGSVSVVKTLPKALTATAAAADLMGNIYIFGGRDGNCVASTAIYRYTPSNNSLVTMGGTLPRGLIEHVATAGGLGFLIVGGGVGPNAWGGMIRYNPGNDTAWTIPMTLPYYVYDATIIAEDWTAYLMGGVRGGGCDGGGCDILKIPLANNAGTVVASEVRLPNVGSWGGASVAYTSAGNAHVTGLHGKIARFIMRPTIPGAPTSPVATAGSASIDLTWSPPTNNGGREVSGYDVYRGTAPGGGAFYRSLGNLTRFQDVNVTVDHRYHYQVVARNFVGPGNRSVEVSAVPYCGRGGNDCFGNATTLSADRPTRFTANTVGATVQPQEPLACGSGITGTVWYKFSAQSSGRAELRRDGGSVPSFMSVYTGNALGSLARVACNDLGGGSDASRIEFDCVSGRTYSIQVADVQTWGRGTTSFALDGCGPNGPETSVRGTRVSAEVRESCSPCVSGAPSSVTGSTRAETTLRVSADPLEDRSGVQSQSTSDNGTEDDMASGSTHTRLCQSAVSCLDLNRTSVTMLAVQGGPLPGCGVNCEPIDLLSHMEKVRVWAASVPVRTQRR